jgi:hypothetical protein
MGAPFPHQHFAKVGGASKSSKIYCTTNKGRHLLDVRFQPRQQVERTHLFESSMFGVGN